ncbi:MAG: hypothetical protein WEA09_00915 [Gemmatimonadota bacterium]
MWRGFSLLALLGVGYLLTFQVLENLHHLGTVQPTGRPAAGTMDAAPWAMAEWSSSAFSGTEVVGAIHVHTQRSHDAFGTAAELAGAARDAGLDFALVTDHMPRNDRDYPAMPEAPDGTPVYPHPFGPDPALKLDEVLLVAGREMSLTVEVGRALTFGLDTLVNPWEGGREALLERARDKGSTLIITHPRSPRVRDRWKDHPVEGFSAMEVLNLSDAARRRLASPAVLHQVASLLAGAALGRLDHALAGLFPTPLVEPELAAWDSLSLDWQIQGVGAANHHPKRRFRGEPFLPYGPFLRVLANHMVLTHPLPDAPQEAGPSLLASLGQVPSHISLVDAHGARGFRMEAVYAPSPDARIRAGEAGPFRPGGVLRAGWPLDEGGEAAAVHRGDDLLFRVMRNGVQEGWWEGRELHIPLQRPGVYRVEVYRRTLRLGRWSWGLSPWIVSNPVWVGMDGVEPSRPDMAESGEIG